MQASTNCSLGAKSGLQPFYCVVFELRMVFTFFNGRKNQKKKNILWPVKVV